MLRNFNHIGRIGLKEGRFDVERGQALDRHGIIAVTEGQTPRLVLDGRINHLLARRIPKLTDALIAGRRVDLWFWEMADPMAAAFTAKELYDRIALDWQPRVRR